ncbi:hypothetical protein A0H81_09272 [Grifola frondosa]|uniref:Uncharacterized protein n=1 Tax=Grifola frondosa TaxID=5627 RepID=A0A1C7M0X1_GRIFR|nr:hypothetical protein A0H81_09272 [Grifola frondosa]
MVLSARSALICCGSPNAGRPRPGLEKPPRIRGSCDCRQVTSPDFINRIISCVSCTLLTHDISVVQGPQHGDYSEVHYNAAGLPHCVHLSCRCGNVLMTINILASTYLRLESKFRRELDI